MNEPKLRFPEFEGEWEEKKLGEVASSFSGGTPKSSESKYYGGDIPFIRSGEIHGCKTELYITEEGLNKSSAKLVSKGDLLIALYGATSGEVAISKIDGAINQAILCVRSQSINSNYLCNYLEYKKDTITSKFLQGGQGNLSSDIIMSLNIPSPSPAEQRKIASCLSAMDDLIAAQAEKVEALKEKKTGLVQQLFPQPGETTPRLRFPEFAGEWDEITFGELIEESKETSTVEDEGILLTSSIEGMFLNSEIFSHQRGSTTIGYRKIKKGMLVLSAQNLHLGNANVNMRFDSGLVSPAYKVYRIIGCLPQYLAHWVKRTATKQFFLDATTQGASECRKNVVWDQLYKQMLTIPSPAEQQKIASCLSALDDQIAAETEKLTALKEHKKGLMQQLFPQPAK